MSDAELLALRDRLSRRSPDADVAAFGDYRRAAVLVPVLLGPDGPRLLFTVRSLHLPHHAGQIAFPGGGVEAGETIEAAARREAFEEVGLEVPASAVLGRLSPLPSPAGYLATPVVAAVPHPARLRLDPGEVEEAFTAPLAELASTVPTHEVRTLRGVPRTIHHYQWRERDIWGFTGNVLREFLAVASTRRAGGGA